jgi:hypothetical protein
MAATLRLVHKAIGVEVRRGTYDVVLDGERVGLSTTFLSPESVSYGWWCWGAATSGSVSRSAQPGTR